MQRPNILFCLADDAGMHFGAYGCRWVRTPGFDRVAREGILMQRAYTPNSKCAPSRACILTGRNSWQLEQAANHSAYFPAKFKGVWEALGDAGYFVGHTRKGWAPGDPGTVNGKPRQLTGPAWNARTLEPPASGICNNDYAGNFEAFLDDRPGDQPFAFWYGCVEPHRGYEYGSGVAKGGRSLDEIDRVPGIWPDSEIVRNDLLDYGYEVEHFDRHLQRMLETLEQRGLLANTLVVVTSDNGMPFPRAKGQEYEYSNHLPMAVMWPAGLQAPGRRVEDYVSFIDLAPTFLEVAGVSQADSGMQPITGRSLMDILQAQRAGQVSPERDHVLIGKERHDVGRPHDWGYPIRGIFRDGWLYLRNFETDRWPAGNPETGYLNCDGSPTKTEILKARLDPERRHLWELAFGKRPAEELYHVDDDPDCLTNLADAPEHAARKQQMADQMVQELTAQGDPRMAGQGHVFDEYPPATDQHDFYERYKAGEKLRAGWVNDTDFETIDP